MRGGDALDVSLRRVRGGPTVFTFGAPSPVTHVVALTQAGARVDLGPQSNGELEAPLDWATLRYRYSVSDAQRSFGGELGWGRTEGGELLVSGNAYLLRPKAPHPDLSATLEVVGAAASLPWPRGEDGRWEVPSMLLAEPGFHAFGGRRCFETVGRGQLEVALIGSTLDEGGRVDAQLCEWIRASAAQVLTLRQQFPATRVLVGLVGAPSDEASPFGVLARSTPPSLGFLVGREAKPSDFKADEMAPKRMVALALPHFDPPAPWLSQGLLAYQAVLARGRSGQLTAPAAWHELFFGIELGAKEAEGFRGDELMRDTAGGRYRAIEAYGALVSLGLDVALRRATGGAQTLDSVLESLGPVPVSADDFARAIDAAAGRPIYQAELKKHRSAVSLRERLDVLQALGLSWQGEQMALSAGPDAALRDAILPPAR